MVGEVTDPLAEDGDLDLGRAGVADFGAVFGDERLLALGSDRHRFDFLQRLITRIGRRQPSSNLAKAIRAWSCHTPTTARSANRPRSTRLLISSGLTLCPLRSRAASAPVRTCAGMSSSAASSGSKY